MACARLDPHESGVAATFKLHALQRPTLNQAHTFFSMKNINHFTRCSLLFILALAGFVLSAFAQEVSIPDAGLNAAIRQTLQKPVGPLTEQDLLSLSSLSAGGRSISNVAGLEFARNLSLLDFDNNSITNFTIASALTNLTILDLFNNHLPSFVLSNALPKLNILDLAF